MLKKNLFAAAAAVGAVLSLSACQEVRVESNLDPQNFVEYAKPASVEVYTDQSILEHRYHSLGMIAGLACQEHENDFIARESEARTDAKLQIANQGGNAVVFNKCVRLEKTKACLVSVTCYAEGFIVDDSFRDPEQKAERERLAAEEQQAQEEKKVALEEALQSAQSDEIEPLTREELAKLSDEERMERAARIALKAEAESKAQEEKSAD